MAFVGLPNAEARMGGCYGSNRLQTPEEKFGVACFSTLLCRYDTDWERQHCKAGTAETRLNWSARRGRTWYIESKFSIIPLELDLDPFLKATPDENNAIISMISMTDTALVYTIRL
jgi:hypothetical protein